MHDYIAGEIETDDMLDDNSATVDDDNDYRVSNDAVIVCLVICAALGLLVWSLACVGAAYMAGWLL